MSFREEWATPGSRFASVFSSLIAKSDKRSLAELSSVLGDERLNRLQNGDEPRLGELIEIGRILGAPWTVFQPTDIGDDVELERALIELRYALAQHNASTRGKVIEAVCGFAEILQRLPTHRSKLT